ncbi:LysR substrate-binding domain-containing protein [Dongshaea marina]|uniref:LysR substrate-binding domain-containing protein n=1 Tax=Dongshaea marina TaxID=2047966 RepID=UPI0019017926|nr:LysR substrate-binding domain-containing protein [Dongshaea marina]
MAETIPAGFSGEHLGSDTAVCVMSRRHPLIAKPRLELADLSRFGHIRITGGGDKDSFVARVLREQGYDYRVQCQTPFFSSALSVLVRSDYLLVTPEHIARNMGQQFETEYRSLPLTTPIHQYWMLWHPRYDQDPAHLWAREHVLGIFRDSIYSVSIT